MTALAACLAMVLVYPPMRRRRPAPAAQPAAAAAPMVAMLGDKAQ